MFCITLQGWLGNQLFQYAFGQMLAKQYQTQVIYDDLNYSSISIFALGCKLGLRTPRNFQLERFEMTITRPSWRQRIRLWSTAFHKIMKKFGRRNVHVKDEAQAYHYDASWFTLDAKKDYLCTGYWNVAQYYQGIQTILQSQIILKTESQTLQEFSKSLKEQQKSWIQTVSIHIRWGDYIKLGMVICDQAYYVQALQQLSDKFWKESLHIWLFSDDPENLPIDIGFLKEYSITQIIFDDYYKAQSIDQAGFDDVEKFILMTRCDHHIIANSTYSRWGAWLGDVKGMTFTPKMWFKNTSSEEVVPKSWERI